MANQNITNEKIKIETKTFNGFKVENINFDQSDSHSILEMVRCKLCGKTHNCGHNSPQL